MIGSADFAFGETRARAALLMPTRIAPADNVRQTPHRDHDLTVLVDSTLEDSFPASDPPSWTASVARPGPADDALVRAGGAGPVRRFLQRAAALF